MLKSLIAIAMLAAPVTQSVPAPMPVYDKGLSAGWENWSWAKTELRADIGSPRMPILVDAQAFGGLFLHHAPFSAKPYRTLTMLIQVVGGPAQVRVMATVGGKGIPDGDKMLGGQPVVKYQLVKLVLGGWIPVTVPLETIGAKDATIDGIMVMNDSSEPAPHIYVADIAFQP